MFSLWPSRTELMQSLVWQEEERHLHIYQTLSCRSRILQVGICLLLLILGLPLADHRKWLRGYDRMM